MAGELAILNVGTGDTKITFDKNKPEERKRACKIVTDMLKRGYAILIQAGEKDGRPVYYRATAFDPETAEYIVAGMPDDAEPEPKPSKRAKQRVKAEGTRAVAVARSAGGMSMAADSIEMQNLRKLDAFAPARSMLAAGAQLHSEWAGIPMPLTDHQLVIEPTYPWAAQLRELERLEEEAKPAEPDTYRWRSTFYSHARRSDVVVFEENGKIGHVLAPKIHGLKYQMLTLGASDAWGVEQEAQAINLLAQLLPHHAFKKYLLTGTFLERSLRSEIIYVFRRLRPTVALSMSGPEPRIIAALCMHPIAYYADSWAGAMCPTDDVIAHLMLMRGDERLFWKRCNQHPAHRPEAGL